MIETKTGKIADLLDRCYFFVLTTGAFGNTKGLKADQYEVDATADKAWTHANKKLLKSPELEAIVKLRKKARNWIAEVSVPSPLSTVMPMIAIAMAEEVEAKMQEYKVADDALVDQFMAKYVDLVRGAETELGPTLFNPTDYPTQDEVKRKFFFEWAFLPPGDPIKLPASVREVERERARARAEEAYGKVQEALRVGMAGLVDHMVESLTPGPGGKQKKFYGTTVTKFAEFLRTFQARNVTDDAELEILVAQAEDLLRGVDPKILKGNQDARERMLQGMTQVKTQLDTMVGDAPARKLSLDDTEF